MGRGRTGGKPRANPGIKGRRPDRKQARRDTAIYNAQRRGDSNDRIAQLYLPK